MKLRRQKTTKGARAKRKAALATGEATQAPAPPPDDPLRRDKQESDLNTREMAEKRLEALKSIREASRTEEEPKSR